MTSLVGHLCQHAGLNTVVAGNIGLPVLDALCDIEDSGVWPEAFVLELSSFQLEGVRSLRADAATVLNISEDHLDRYQDLLDYAHSKTTAILPATACRCSIRTMCSAAPWRVRTATSVALR